MTNNLIIFVEMPFGNIYSTMKMFKVVVQTILEVEIV